MKTLTKFLGVCGFCLIVAACAKNPFIVTQSNCPAASVVANAGTLVHFEGEGRDVEDILFEADISAIQTTCEQDDGIYHEVSFAIMAKRMPGADITAVRLPYFVVLMRDNNLITAKRVYEATIEFAPGSDTAGVKETLVQTFDDLDIARRYDYELLIGFQLTPDQVAFNLLR